MESSRVQRRTARGGVKRGVRPIERRGFKGGKGREVEGRGKGRRRRYARRWQGRVGPGRAVTSTLPGPVQDGGQPGWRRECPARRHVKGSWDAEAGEPARGATEGYKDITTESERGASDGTEWE